MRHLGIGTRRLAIWIAHVTLTCAACPRLARAITLNPICSKSPITLPYIVDSRVSYQLDRQPDSNCAKEQTNSTCPHYGNHVSWQVPLLTNGYVNYVSYTLSPVDLETDWDWIYGGTIAYPSATRITGAHSSTSINVGYPPDVSFQRDPAILRLESDNSITRAGFAAPQVLAMHEVTDPGCTYDSATTSLQVGVRYTGILLGTGDVIYTSFPAMADGHDSIAMWPNDSRKSDVDVDVLVRCNALPTATTYDYSSTRGMGTGDFLHLPQGNGATCAGGTWYVALYSYNGQGAFNVMHSAHKQAHHFSHFPVSIADWVNDTPSNYNDKFSRMARLIYGATKGSVYIESIDNFQTKELGPSDGRCGASAIPCYVFWENNLNNGGQTRGVTNGGYPTPGAGRRASYFHFNPPDDVISHELGHLLFNLPEEYVNGVGHTCGYSLMSAHLWYPHNFCTDRNHLQDPGATGSPPPNSMWSLIQNAGYVSIDLNSTPDAYSFADFDFSNRLGTVSNPL